MEFFPKVTAVTVISLLAIFIGCLTEAGWIFNLPILETVISNYVSMKFNTALCFIFLSGSILITQLNPKKYNTAIYILFAFIVLVISGVTLSQYLLRYDAGIDQLFFKDYISRVIKYPFPGRMSKITAICFFCISLSLFGFITKPRFIQSMSQYLLHAVTAIAAVSVIGYLYKLSLFYNPTSIYSMAINTAILFFFLSIVASLLRPALGITALFTGNLIGNKMARRLLVIIVSLIAFLGVLRSLTIGYNFFSFEVVVSLLAVCFLITGLIIIWHTAIWLNKSDLKRYEAEEEVRLMNEKLEQRVEERSAELRDLLEKYRESESKLRTAFEYSAIGMGLIALNGNWLQVNKRWCELVGYSEQELLSMKFLDITHPEDMERHVDLMKAALKGESEAYQYEKRYITKNRAVLWVSVNFTAVRNKEGGPMYFISQFVDITGRKETEAAQKLIIENEERLRAIFDNVEGAACLMGTDLRLIAFNKVFSGITTLLGGNEPQIGDEAYGFLPDEERKRRYEIVQRVLKGNKESLEAEFERGGKRLYYRTSFNPVIVDGKVTAVSSYSLDLTSWKEAEDKVRKADARFRAIVESVFVGIKLTDVNRKIIYRSPSMQKINGWNDKEMESHYLTYVHPDDLGLVEKTHQEVLLNPDMSINIIYRILHKNGSYIWIESQLCNKLNDMDIGAIITVTRDVTERKLVEDKLIKSEEKYRSLIEHASDAIYLVDYAGNFTDVNESMCKMTGYSKTELLQLHIEQLIDPEQLMVDPIQHGPLGLENAIIRERRFVYKDGHIFDVEINVKRFHDDKVLVIARDITGRKQMETELRNAELKFRTLAEKSMVGVYISQGERFLYLNPRFAEIFGYETQELLDYPGNVADILYSEEDKPHIQQKVEERFGAQADAVSYEVTGKRKDGTFNQVEFYGSKVILDGSPAIIGTMLDVTERRKSEEILKRSEANLKTIMDTTDTAYVLMDKELNLMAFNQMAVKFINSEFRLFPGKSNQFFDSLPKEHFQNFLMEQLDSFHNKRLAQFIDNTNEVLKGKNINYEISYPQPDGTLLWYFIRLFPITNDRNEIFGLLMELSDVTERKTAEENLKTAYVRIQEHLNSIKEMAWKQSHLVRGPLANLKGLSVMLNDNPADARVLKFMMNELERLDNVIIEMARDASNNEY